MLVENEFSALHVELEKTMSVFKAEMKLLPGLLKQDVALFLVVAVVVVIRPLPMDGGMSEDHGSPKAGQILRA